MMPLGNPIRSSYFLIKKNKLSTYLVHGKLQKNNNYNKCRRKYFYCKQKCMNVTYFSKGNYIRIIMITFGENIYLKKKRKMKITYFVQRKLHKNIMIRFYNPIKIEYVIE